MNERYSTNESTSAHLGLATYSMKAVTFIFMHLSRLFVKRELRHTNHPTLAPGIMLPLAAKLRDPGLDVCAVGAPHCMLHPHPMSLGDTAPEYVIQMHLRYRERQHMIHRQHLQPLERLPLGVPARVPTASQQ